MLGSNHNQEVTKIFFLITSQNICCGYSLEVPQWGTSNEYPQHMFLWKIRKIIAELSLLISTETYVLGTSNEYLQFLWVFVFKRFAKLQKFLTCLQYKLYIQYVSCCFLHVSVAQLSHFLHEWHIWNKIAETVRNRKWSRSCSWQIQQNTNILYVIFPE